MNVLSKMSPDDKVEIVLNGEKLQVTVGSIVKAYVVLGNANGGYDDLYFKVWSEYDIGDEELPNILYVKADSVDKIHDYLESYCESCGLDYQIELVDRMFTIEEIELSDVFVEL